MWFPRELFSCHQALTDHSAPGWAPASEPRFAVLCCAVLCCAVLCLALLWIEGFQCFKGGFSRGYKGLATGQLTGLQHTRLTCRRILTRVAVCSNRVQYLIKWENFEVNPHEWTPYELLLVRVTQDAQFPVVQLPQSQLLHTSETRPEVADVYR